MIWPKRKKRSPWTWKNDLADKVKAEAKLAHDEHVAHVAAIRVDVFAREKDLCRAWVDGYRFDWCQRVATDMHEGKSRGSGGQVSTENSIALCHACHMKKHGIGAWLRILVTDANRADGVTFIARLRNRIAA